MVVRGSKMKASLGCVFDFLVHCVGDDVIATSSYGSRIPILSSLVDGFH